MPLPVRFRPIVPLTDEELYLFSSRNEVVWIEREANGDIHIKPITSTLVGAVSADVMCQLAQWVEREACGQVLAGAGFFLPDGSMLGPRIALVGPEKWSTVEDRKKDGPKRKDGFAHFVPDFVAEFNGPWDEPGEMDAKMRQWIANGVQVGWLINAVERAIVVYRSGVEPEHFADPSSVQGTGPIAGFELGAAGIWWIGQPMSDPSGTSMAGIDEYL